MELSIFLGVLKKSTCFEGPLGKLKFTSKYWGEADGSDDQTLKKSIF